MKTRFLAIALLVVAIAAPKAPASAASVSTNSAIKGVSNSAVYWYATDGKRYVFPTEGTYYSWFSDFSQVKIISDQELSSITIGGNVTYRPGAKLLKINTDPRTYAVSKGGYLRLIASESVASNLYGYNWAQKVHDLPDTFFTNYKMGSTLYSSTDYNVSNEYYSVNNPSDTIFNNGTPNNPFPDYPTYPNNPSTVTLTTDRNSINEGESITLSGRVFNAPSYSYRLEIKDTRNGSSIRSCDNTTYCDTTVRPYRNTSSQNTVQYFMVLKRTSDNQEMAREYSQVIYFNGYSNGTFSSGSSSLQTNKTSVNNGESVILTATVTNVTVADNQLRMEFYRERDNTLLYTCYDARTCNYTAQINAVNGSNSERFYVIVKNDNNEQIPAAYSSRISINNINNNGTGITSSATSYTENQQMTLSVNFSDQSSYGYIQYVDLRNNNIVYTCYNTNYCNYVHYAPSRINNETTVRYSARYYANNENYYRATKESTDLYLPSTTNNNYQLTTSASKSYIANGESVGFTLQLMNAPSTSYRLEIYDQNGSMRAICVNTTNCYLTENVNKSGSQSTAQYQGYLKDHYGNVLLSKSFPVITFNNTTNYTTLTGTTALTISPSGSRPAYSQVTLTANVTNSNYSANDLTVFIWAGTTPTLVKTCTNTSYCSASYYVGNANMSIPVYASVTTKNATNALISQTSTIYTY